MAIISNDKGAMEFLAELVRYDEEAKEAYFNFDLGFGQWHVEKVKVLSWFPLEWKNGQTFTVFVSVNLHEPEPKYEVSVWMRED